MDKSRESSKRCSFGVVDRVLSLYVAALVSEGSDRFKGSVTMTSTLGHLHLTTHSRIFPSYHQQCHVGSDKGAATMVRHRFGLVIVVVVRYGPRMLIYFLLHLGDL